MSKSVRIVLSGSGILYPLHAGALQALTEEGYQIEAITGVSGGAIVGSAVASGYTPGKELNELILDTMPTPNDLLDPNWLGLWNWGLYSGDRILGKFREHLTPTFENLHPPLKVTTVNVDKMGDRSRRYSVFSTEHTPAMDLPLAVRASMCFPFVFEPVRIHGDRHVDGGVASMYPIDIWGEGEDVIGFHIRGGGPDTKPGKGICGLLEYAGALLDTMLHSINREHIEDAQFAKTVVLNTHHSPLYLDMTRDEAAKLIESGRRMTLQRLDT